MTQLERLKARIVAAEPGILVDYPNGSLDIILADLLESAQAAILARRHPFGDDIPTELPNRYLDLQVRVATVMFGQLGAEGESAHSESNVSRTWVGLEDLLAEVRPMAKVLSTGG